MRAGHDRHEHDGATTGPVGEPALAAATVLGTEANPSPLDLAEGTTALLEMDRLEIGTPVADLGTAAVSRP